MLLVRLILMLLAFSGLICSSVPAQTVIVLTDTAEVQVILDRIQSSVRQENADKLFSVTEFPATFGSRALDRKAAKSALDSVFVSGHARPAGMLKPQELPFGAFWDFGIDNTTYEFSGDSCMVTCRLILHAAPREKGNPYTSDEVFYVAKVGHSWLLKSSENLFDFLLEGGNK